jgi:hypothetical protein
LPCYQVRKTSVTIDAADDEMLAKAIEALGGTDVRILGKGHIEFRDLNRQAWVKGGKMVVDVRSALAQVDAVKVAYSNAVVQAAAAKFGQRLVAVPQVAQVRS